MDQQLPLPPPKRTMTLAGDYTPDLSSKSEYDRLVDQRASATRYAQQAAQEAGAAAAKLDAAIKIQQSAVDAMVARERLEAQQAAARYATEAEPSHRLDTDLTIQGEEEQGDEQEGQQEQPSFGGFQRQIPTGFGFQPTTGYSESGTASRRGVGGKWESNMSWRNPIGFGIQPTTGILSAGTASRGVQGEDGTISRPALQGFGEANVGELLGQRTSGVGMSGPPYPGTHSGQQAGEPLAAETSRGLFQGAVEGRAAERGVSGAAATPTASEWAVPVYKATRLIEAAAAVGQVMTLAEALSISQARERSEAAVAATAWRPPAGRTVAAPRSTQDRLNGIEKSMPSYDGTGNVYDFVYKVEHKLAQQNVVDELERHTLLASKLTGKAFTAMRNNAAQCSSFAGTLAFLRETYGPSVAGVRAQLLALKFHPNSENARQFNERFNAIAGTAPSGSIAVADLRSIYLQALGRGDQLLMKDAIWYGNVETMSLSDIQRTLVSKLDNFSILATSGLSGGADALSAAYKPVAYDDNISDTASDAATATSSIAQLMRAVQEAKQAVPSAPRQFTMPPPAAASPAGTGTAVGQRWAETRTCHICKKVGHIATNCPNKTERRNTMVNKAVGLVLDHLDKEAAAADAAEVTPAVPYATAGCTMPGYALRAPEVPATAVTALKDWQEAPSEKRQNDVASSFANALAQYCFANPRDERAGHYMAKVEGFGEAALQDMVQGGDTELVNRILVERRRTVGTQAGDRGAAEDLWPGITDTLGALPAKTNVFEWLKESQKFCVSIIELAMEIAMDNGWRMDYARMEAEITRARGVRAFGQYAADSRAKSRLHGAEGGRILSGRAAAQAAAAAKPTRWDVPPPTQPMQEDEAQTSYAVRTPQQLVASAYSFEAARANVERDFGACEDMTSLSGPPTPHLIVQVVLCFNGRAVKVTAIRDTGSPDTIMTQGLYKHLGMTGGIRTERTFAGLGSQPAPFAGVCGALEVRLTPKIQVTNPCYITPDGYCLFILGNDIFNKERVETLTQNDQTGVYLLRYQNVIDVLPYRQMTTEERQKRELQFAKPAASDAPAQQGAALRTAYERAAWGQAGFAESSELLIASQAAQMAISATPAEVPQQLHLAIVDFPRLEAIDELQDEGEDDRVAYEAAAAAIEDSFLEF